MSFARKTYDTDVITLRRIFANTPGTNTPISSGFILATGEYGASAFINPVNLPAIATLSTSIGTGGGGGGANIVAPGVCTLSTLLVSGLSSLSTAIGSGIGGGGVTFSISSVSTVFSYGTVNISSAVNVFLHPLQLSTLTVSSGNVFTSSLNFKDTASGTDQLLAVTNGLLLLNGTQVGVGGSLASFISTANLASLVSTANLTSLVSTSFLDYSLGSTISGLSNVAVTKIIAGSGISINPGSGLGQVTITNTGGGGGGGITSDNLVSTVIGLGSAGYISSASGSVNVTGLISTANLFDLVSTANLTDLISTSYLASQLTSSVIGLGNLGYLSSFSSLAINFSTGFFRAGTSQMVTLNFVDTGNQAIQTLTASNNALYFNGNPVGTGAVINNFNTSTYIYQVSSVSTVITQGITFISSATNVILSNSSSFTISTGSIVTSSIVFIDTILNTFQLLAVKNGILQLNGSGIQGGGGSNLVSTANLADLVSTPYLASQLTSTVIGLGTLGYLSTLPVIGGFISTANLATLVSTANLASLVSTANLATLVSTANLATLVSTANLASLVSTANLATLVSTPYLASQLTSTVIGLGTLGYLSTLPVIGGFISTANLMNLVSTANLASLISTANLASLVSTANLNDLVSTSFFDTRITSSFVGLGTMGYLSTYISTFPFLSTNTINAEYVYATQVQASTIWFANQNADIVVQDYYYQLFVSSSKLIFSPSQLAPMFGQPYDDQVILNSIAQSTTTGLTTNFIGQQGQFSNLLINSDPINSITSSINNNANRLNFSSLFVNNVPIIFDSNGNLQLTFQSV